MADEIVNIKNPPYNAVGEIVEGISDDVAIQMAIDDVSTAGGGQIFFPCGSYRCIYQINLHPGVELVGVGPESLITFDGASEENFPDNGCIFAQGSLAPLPSLGEDVSEHDMTINFSAPVSEPHGLNQDDVFVIWNSANSSFNPARDYYFAGEWMKVVRVGSNTVMLDAPAYDSYPSLSPDIQISRLDSVRVAVRNLKVLGLGTTSTVAVVRCQLGRGCDFENLTLQGSQYACLLFERCYECSARGIKAFDFWVNENLNYGIAIANSQRLLVSDCQITARRHAVSLGGNDADSAVPCREIRVSDSVLTGPHIAALDAHGNCEHYTFENCTINGGVDLGGDRGELRGCKIKSSPDNAGRAITFVEMIGVDFTIADCEITQVREPGGSPPALVRMDLLPPAVISRPDGVLRILNTRIRAGTGERPIFLRSRSSSEDALNLDVEIRGCTITRSTDDEEANSFVIVACLPESPWRRVIIESNHFRGCGPAIHGPCEEKIIRNNTVLESRHHGIMASEDPPPLDQPPPVYPFTRQLIDIHGNLVDRSWRAGIYVKGWHRDIADARIRNNISLRNSQIPVDSNEFSSSFYATNLNLLEATDNIVGDDQVTTTQMRNFALHEINLAVVGGNTIIGSNALTNINDVTQRVSRYVDNNAGNRKIAYDTDPPITGHWIAGDRVWNINPNIGQPIGWICITSGNPGTWQPMPSL